MRTFARLAVSVLFASLAVTGLSFAGTGLPVSSNAPDVGSLAERGFTASDSTPGDRAARDDAGAVEAADVEADDARDPESRPVEFSTVDCPDGFSGNHGEYVSSVPEDERRDAARSSCGKPVPAVERPRAGAGQGARPDHAGPPEHAGAPEHAGRPEHAGPPEGKSPPHRGGPAE